MQICFPAMIDNLVRQSIALYTKYCVVNIIYDDFDGNRDVKNMLKINLLYE